MRACVCVWPLQSNIADGWRRLSSSVCGLGGRETNGTYERVISSTTTSSLRYTTTSTISLRCHSPISLSPDRDLVSTGLGSPAVRLFPTCRRPPCLLLHFVVAVVQPCLEPDRNGPGTSLVFRYVPSFRRRIANEETSATSG